MNQPYLLLIVGDKSSAGSAVDSLLPTDSYRICRVTHGAEALEAAQRERPAILLCERTLYDMDGQELCRRVKSDSSLQSCYLIMLATREEETETLAADADDVLFTPYSASEIQTRVRIGTRFVEMQRRLDKELGGDTVSKLRHDVNNSLFAICGSAESALKRLQRLNAVESADVQPIITQVERILLGAERIRASVAAFPGTTDS